MDVDNGWTYIEDDMEHQVTEIEYFWHLTSKIPVVLNTQDMELILHLLCDLEKFVAEAISLPHIEQINRFIPLVRDKIHGSNTPAEMMLLWIENLDREEALEEQRENIWQQAIGMENIGTDYDRSAA